jgi:hypothetical protein
MDIKELYEKYKLQQDDVWELSQKPGTWIISHNACEKIASIEKIRLDKIEVLNSEWNFSRLIVTMSKGDIKTESIGEALLIDGEVLKKTTSKGKPVLKGNCDIQYIGCMAEKRGIDRCVLKLIDAYQYGIYSDSESNEFEKPKPDQDLPEKSSSKITMDNDKPAIATKEQWERFTGLINVPGNKAKIDAEPSLQAKCKFAFSNQKEITKIMMDDILEKLDEICIPF